MKQNYLSTKWEIVKVLIFVKEYINYNLWHLHFFDFINILGTF